MTRGRQVSAALYALMLCVRMAQLASCELASPGGAASSLAGRSASSPLLASARVSPAVNHTDPAVRVAVLFERAHCGWDWHQSRHAYLAAQQKLATPVYAARLAAASDATSWRHAVVAQQQTVICTVSGAHRAVGAPSTSSTVYVRMTVDSEITSTLGTFAGGQRIESWLVRRVGARWLVAGSFEGG